MKRRTLILHIFLLLDCGVFAQGPQLIFEQYGYTDLADWVRCMYQDSRGFLWIGVVDELRRFDGYNVISYESQPGDTTSLSGNYIQCILEDHSGVLWFGTLSDGLNKYNRYTDKFSRYQHSEKKPYSISNNRINAIFEDHEQNLWVAAGGDLNRLDRKTNRFIFYQPNAGMINSIDEDASGMLWITTSGGLFLFDRHQERFIPFGEYFSIDDPFKNKNTTVCCHDSSDTFWVGADGIYQFNEQLKKIDKYSINTGPMNVSNKIQAICDAGSFLWIGTNDGLYHFDKEKMIFTRYAHDPANYLSLFENNIMAILHDRSGCFWFSGASKGINKRNSIRGCVKFYLPNPFDSGSIEDRIVSLFLSKSGKIWIGTHAYGILSFDKLKEKFQNYQHEPGNPNSLCDNDVRSIIEDKNGHIWIATNNGLNRFDPESNRFTWYSNITGDPNSLSNNCVQSLLETTDGSIYIGTDNGLNRYNSGSEKFTRYMPDPAVPTSINNQNILTLYEDIDQIIWIGTMGGGLNRLDPKTGQFAHYVNDPSNPFSIGSNTVEAVYEYPFEKRPTLWIGAQGGGLCRFDKQTERFYTYSKKNGLPANRVQQIIADHTGNFWLATIAYITRFNPTEMTIKNYELSSEMPVNPHTCVIDRDGEIFFGGFRGMVRFFPDSLTDNAYLPPVVLTELRVNNQLAQLDTAITEKKMIILPYDKNNLSFEFSALDFNRPEMNQYAYKMEGLDNDWVYTDAKRRYAAYTYVDPGEYIFRVKASNNDGVWNEQGTFVSIMITPPWWKTSWAYTLYLVLILGAILIVWRFQTNRLKIIHQLEIEHIHSEKLQEIDRMRSRFFANISHEFRTPLTLILGPVEQMLSGNFKGNLQNQYQLILRNGRRLLRLINQLLDLSRLESGGMTLQIRKENIAELIGQYVQSFESLARRKNIHLSFTTEQPDIFLYCDRDKIEKILNNLLSNAFKFTPAGGHININLGIWYGPLNINKKSSKWGSYDNILRTGSFSQNAIEDMPGIKSKALQISVTDTGTGIPSDRLDKIFDRFYQVDDSQKRGYEGTGIGLALTKELVELHQGKINVQSEYGKGSVFTILLPIESSHLQSKEIAADDHAISTDSEFIPENNTMPVTDYPLSIDLNHSSNTKGRLPHILIVEDNPDMRAYMRSYLDQSYLVREAVNGKKGWEEAIRNIPDLIISDVMMPETDGLEFCAKLKNDMRTSHIPVILLTARVETKDKIEGLETGADDYLVKPFIAGELLVRVHNLIRQRRELRERYSNEIKPDLQKLATGSVDEKFLLRMHQTITNNLANANFKLDDLAEAVGMSRMTMHRKIMGISGQSPGNLIRTIRLKRAAELLRNKTINISEIAYAVGFESPANFAKNFRRQFGTSPSRYSKQIQSAKPDTN